MSTPTGIPTAPQPARFPERLIEPSPLATPLSPAAAPVGPLTLGDRPTEEFTKVAGLVATSTLPKAPVEVPAPRRLAAFPLQRDQAHPVDVRSPRRHRPKPPQPAVTRPWRTALYAAAGTFAGGGTLVIFLWLLTRS